MNYLLVWESVPVGVADYLQVAAEEWTGDDGEQMQQVVKWKSEAVSRNAKSQI